MNTYREDNAEQHARNAVIADTPAEATGQGLAAIAFALLEVAQAIREATAAKDC
ncbi:hypothetical protein ABZY57_04545 [Streptomyces sp. NPDC006450]|uniref:hypothetical protein n=1 Tax=Streptomyces sp. NPDC006450 TaxID=3155458 RepID=UPI0033BF0859